MTQLGKGTAYQQRVLALLKKQNSSSLAKQEEKVSLVINIYDCLEDFKPLAHEK